MKKLLWLMIIVIVAFLTAFLLPKFQQKVLPQPQFSLYYQHPRIMKPFQLNDNHGESFTNKELENKWSFVFIGYTSCPDVCPTTLLNLKYVYDKIKNIAPNSQILFLSVDPKRDNITKLNKYINYFNPEFIALRAEHDVLIPFTRNLGLMYSIVANEDEDKIDQDDNYSVNHSASIALINPQGQVTALFKPETTIGRVPNIDGDKLVRDFAKIIKLNTQRNKI
jgi:protein SCO1/2